MGSPKTNNAYHRLPAIQLGPYVLGQWPGRAAAGRGPVLLDVRADLWGLKYLVQRAVELGDQELKLPSAKSACQCVNSNPLTPSDASVGTPDLALRRAAHATASSGSLPLFM
jgi:hypothetical protein